MSGIRVRFVESSGIEHVVGGAPGATLMRLAADRLVPGILGECGGAMACGTCHAYVDPPWGEQLPPPSAQERAILEGCMEVRPTSRLTCQIRLTPELDGLTLHLPTTQT